MARTKHPSPKKRTRKPHSTTKKHTHADTPFKPRPAVRNTGGRPAFYNENSFPHIAYVLTKEKGLTMMELARVFGVAESAIYAWRRRHPEFRDAVIKGWDEFNTEKVETSLLKRALGYTYEEVRQEEVTLKAKRGNGVECTLPGTKTITTIKEVPPEPGMIEFFLKNRAPQRWPGVQRTESNNVHRLENTVGGQGEVQAKALENMSVEELRVARKLAQQHQEGEIIEAETENRDDELDAYLDKAEE